MKAQRRHAAEENEDAVAVEQASQASARGPGTAQQPPTPEPAPAQETSSKASAFLLSTGGDEGESGSDAEEGAQARTAAGETRGQLAQRHKKVAVRGGLAAAACRSTCACTCTVKTPCAQGGDGLGPTGTPSRRSHPAPTCALQQPPSPSLVAAQEQKALKDQVKRLGKKGKEEGARLQAEMDARHAKELAELEEAAPGSTPDAGLASLTLEEGQGTEPAPRQTKAARKKAQKAAKEVRRCWDGGTCLGRGTCLGWGTCLGRGARRGGEGTDPGRAGSCARNAVAAVC